MTTNSTTGRTFFQILVETNNGNNEDDIKDLFVASMGEDDAVKAALESQLSKENLSVHTSWFKAAEGDKPSRMTCANEVVSLVSAKEISAREFVRDTPLHQCILTPSFNVYMDSYHRQQDNGGCSL